MPTIFQDVLRDLLANARKYTKPGGRITAGLRQNSDLLRFLIIDNGIGIPPAEILNVVKFGYRASNVADRVTHGGGFGLTKAFYVTRKFGGQMWVDSAGVEGKSTRVEICIPLPESLTT
jgi:signal transduction histidine kinase